MLGIAPLGVRAGFEQRADDVDVAAGRGELERLAGVGVGATAKSPDASAAIASLRVRRGYRAVGAGCVRVAGDSDMALVGTHRPPDHLEPVIVAGPDHVATGVGERTQMAVGRRLVHRVRVVAVFARVDVKPALEQELDRLAPAVERRDVQQRPAVWRLARGYVPVRG